MKNLKIALFGGTGFVGHHLCSLLASQGHTVTVFSRRPDQHKELTILPTVSVEEADVYNINSVLHATQGHDAVINLIGILNEAGHRGEGFRHVHIDSTRNIVQACQRNKIPRLIQMSALCADPQTGNSYYSLSKGEAERLAQAANTEKLHVTSFRPSVIYGPGDSFLTKFAKVLKWSPGLMMLPSSEAILSPIYVGDVVRAIATSLNLRETYGQHYELCGPQAYTLKQLVEYIAEVTKTRRKIIGLSNKASKIVAHIMEYMPFKPYSVDNYLTALKPSICKNPFPVIFNIQPVSLETIVPSYLGPNHLKDRFSALRELYSKSKN